MADVDNWAEIAAGFVSDTSKVTGFSHLHDSGKYATELRFLSVYTNPFARNGRRKSTIEMFWNPVVY